MGMPEAEIAQALRLNDGDEDDDENAFELWPENLRTLEMFFACKGQRVIGPMGGVVGLRAEGVESVMRMRRIPFAERAELFADLEMMMAAAAPILNATN